MEEQNLTMRKRVMYSDHQPIFHVLNSAIDDGVEPRTVAVCAMTVRAANHISRQIGKETLGKK
jgi:hypothetical protein